MQSSLTRKQGLQSANFEDSLNGSGKIFHAGQEISFFVKNFKLGRFLNFRKLFSMKKGKLN
jgi:hypothetical protein